jgi:hypothetical protein
MTSRTAAPEPIAVLVTRYRQDAETFRRYGADAQAKLLEHVAQDIDRAVSAGNDELLSLVEAQCHSAYSADHLRRLAREGKVHSVRKGRRLYFKRGELPRKPERVDAPLIRRYDPNADARRVAARRTRGDSPNGTHTAD